MSGWNEYGPQALGEHIGATVASMIAERDRRIADLEVELAELTEKARAIEPDSQTTREFGAIKPQEDADE